MRLHGAIGWEVGAGRRTVMAECVAKERMVTEIEKRAAVVAGAPNRARC
jgi:hypothetical protein